jgi:hypothetical protein
MGFVNIRSRFYIAGTIPLDLSDDEKLALLALLTRTIADDRVIPVTGCSHLEEEHSPSSDPSRTRALTTAPKVYAPPRATGNKGPRRRSPVPARRPAITVRQH